MPRTLGLAGPRQLRLADQPTRPLGPGEVRLRARLSGISHGTELSLYRGTSAFTDKVFDRGLRAFVEPPAGSAATYPVTLGYEMVGQVTEVAPDVHEVAVGDLVHTGTPHQEETVLDLAASLRTTYPLVKLPSPERPERALFISLAAVALQAVHDAEMKLGDAVSVHGLGAIGLLTVQMCRLEGIQNVFAIDPDPERRKLAAGLGASHVLDPANGQPVGLQIRDLNGDAGVDVAVEVSGSDRGLQGALEAAGLGARVVAAPPHGPWGAPPPPRPPVEPPPGDGHRHPAALHRPGVDRRAAGPPVPVRPGARRLPLDRRAPPGHGQGRVDLLTPCPDGDHPGGSFMR